MLLMDKGNARQHQIVGTDVKVFIVCMLVHAEWDMIVMRLFLKLAKSVKLKVVLSIPNGCKIKIWLQEWVV